MDPKIKEIWKTYPVRVPGHSQSACHDAPTILVQSMEGGFVTRNCPTCGDHDYLKESSFRNEIDLWVACPICKQRMVKQMVEKNYAFACESCDGYITLAALLPRFSEI